MTATRNPKKSLGPAPLLYPLPALLVCTYDAGGKANVMTAAWGGICSSDPLSLTVSIRPARWTHDALLARKAFTVCIPSESMMVETDYVGIVSGRRYDKAARAGFSMVRAEKVDAPYVAQCPVILECALTHTLEIKAHTMMVGEILDVKADEACLAEGGKAPDMLKVAPVIFDAGGGAYYGVGKYLGKAFSAGKKLIKHDEE